MRIVVFGASGQTGRIFVPLALDAGHEVTAFVRSTSTRPDLHDRLRLVVGDVLQPVTLAPAVEGQDAVVILLGRPARRARQLRTRGTAKIVEAMQTVGVSRVICLTTFGYGDGAAILARATFVFRNIIAPLLLGDTLADHEGQEAALRQSGLAWTIIRAPWLKDEPATGKLKTDIERTQGPIRPVSRADVARLFLEILERGSHIREVVSVSS